MFGFLAFLVAVVEVGLFAFGYTQSTFMPVMSGLMCCLGSLAAAVIFGFGLMLSSMFAENGRFAAFIAPCVGGFLWAVFGYMMVEATLGFHGNYGAYGAVGMYVFSALPGLVYVTCAGKGIREAVQDAPSCAKWTIENFTALDPDGDGLIIRGHIEDALSNPEWGESERYVLTHLLSNWHEVGHKIGEKTNTHISVMPIGASMVPTVIASTDSIFAIAREDLNSYPERLRAKWRKWL